MQVAELIQEADAIGDRLRYGHQGFLVNKRQLRMGGLAAIELAQTLRSAVRRDPFILLPAATTVLCRPSRMLV